MAIDSAEPITQEILAAAESLRPLLEPRSVALIGASRSEKKIGGAILSNLVAGYAGALYVVNPEVSEVRGIKCYPSISAIGELIDLAVIATPAHTVPTIVEECGRAGIKGVVIISAGFAEISAPQGRELQDRVTSIAKSFGMRIIGPNCLGVLNTDPALNFNATFAPISPPAGNVGFLSQSGALAIAALDYARAHNIGLSSFVSVGNKADVSSNDMLAYWACDKRTKVIALYLESFGNPRNFVRIAPEVSRTTPIVAVKSGRSVAGKRAASSHSASLASVESAVDAVFSQTGVIRTDTLEQLYDVINLLATQPEPGGPRVGVITNAGGPGILAVDALEGEGLKVPELSERVISKLKTFLPPHASLTNPVDMIASAGPEHFLKSISALGTSGEVDCLLVIYVPPMVSDPESIARAIAEGAAAIPNELPIATIFLSSKGAPPVLSNGPRGPIPSYSFPENAAHALAASYRHKRWKEKRRGERIVLEEDKARSIREIVLGSPSSGPQERWLPFPSICEALAELEIRSPRQVVLAPAERVTKEHLRGFSYPLVLKLLSSEIIHKTEVGGVILGIRDFQDLERALRRLKAATAALPGHVDGYLVQEEIQDGVEAFVGVAPDPTFGPLLMCGIGGTQVELLKDIAFSVVPVTDSRAEEMIGSLKAKALLEGFRGAPSLDKEALVEIILKTSALVEAVPEVSEIDFNPIKVLPRGEGAVVVDARVRFAADDSRRS